MTKNLLLFVQNPEIWKEYQTICDKAHGTKVNMLEVSAFCQKNKGSFEMFPIL